jgi:hypothetical protein
MRDLLQSLNVANPEADRFYSTGGTVTRDSIVAALAAVEQVRNLVRQLSERLNS